MTVREIVSILEKDGWVKVRQKGSHMIYKKNNKTCPIATRHSDIPPGTLANIARITRVKF